MGSPKGRVKTGGRKKGTPNKQAEELRDIADRLGVNPFEVLLLFAKGDWKALGYKKRKYAPDPEIHPSIRARAAAEANQYLHPKRKAIEHSAPGLEDALRELSDDQLDERIQTGLEKLKK